MKYIIDTHVFIWANLEPSKLSTTAIKILEKTPSSVYLSAASIWEMAIKANLKKLEFDDIGQFVNQGCKFLNCKVLPILVPHILKVEGLDNHHKDPFDRLIIAQSIVTKYSVVSIDTQFGKYPVNLIW
jgi:PIN domain nuclease of toxin-antitoxin system